MATRSTNVAPRKKPDGAYRHGDLHNALLDAAGDLVAQRGGPDFSLREIAAQVGVRHAAAYRHFAAKEDIIAALATRAFERMGQRFAAAALRARGDPEAHIEGLADAYMSMVRDEPGAYRVMFANVPGPDPAREAAARACFDALLSAIEAGQRSGLVRRDLPAIAIAAVNWSGLHGLALLLLDERLGETGPAGGSKALSAALRAVHRTGWEAS